MPFFALIITPLIALYIKFRIAGILLRIVIYDAIYILFTTATNDLINRTLAYIVNINVPCSVAWILNDLQFIAVITIYINLLLSAATLKLIFKLAMRVV